MVLLKKINSIKSKYLKLQAYKTKNRKNIVDEEDMSVVLENKETQVININEEEVINYNETMKALNPKLKDKLYGIEEVKYEKICGSREDVWNGKAYKTSGGLIKEDLLMHKSGKIISKRKCILETNYNRFVKCGVNKGNDQEQDQV